MPRKKPKEKNYRNVTKTEPEPGILINKVGNKTTSVKTECINFMAKLNTIWSANAIFRTPFLLKVVKNVTDITAIQISHDKVITDLP